MQLRILSGRLISLCPVVRKNTTANPHAANAVADGPGTDLTLMLLTYSNGVGHRNRRSMRGDRIRSVIGQRRPMERSVETTLISKLFCAITIAGGACMGTQQHQHQTSIHDEQLPKSALPSRNSALS